MPTNAPDVRVRLSAEGVTDVVAAFKKIQAEAEKTGQSSRVAGQGAAFLKDQLAGLGEVMPALTAAVALIKFVEMGKSAMEAAVNIAHLQQKTGLTTETLSVFSFAAQQVGTDAESMGKGLVKATRFMDEYDKGATKAKDTVKNLFGNEDALKGLSNDQRILKTVDALAKLEPGAKRTGAAMAIFGKAGAELIPMLDQLGSGGVEQLRAKMEKLGLVMNEDVVRASEQAHAALKDIEAAGQGMALQFMSGLLPAITDVVSAITDGLDGDGKSAFKRFGEAVGNDLKLIVLTCWHLVAVILEIGAKTSALVQNIARAGSDLVTLGPVKAWQQFKNNVVGDADRIEELINSKNAAIERALAGGNRVNANKPKTHTDNSRSEDEDNGIKDVQKLAEARRKLIEAGLNAELAILKAKNKLANDEEKDRFEQGLVGVEQYYKDRAARINAEADAEVALIKQKIKAEQDAVSFERTRELKKGESEADRQAEVMGHQGTIKGLQAQVAVKEIDRNDALTNNSKDQAVAARELAKAQLEGEAQIANAEGRRFDAERAQLAAEIAGMQRLKGETDAAFNARKDTLQNAGNQKIDFSQLQEKAKLALDALAQDRKQIDDQVAKGALDQLNAQERLRLAEQARLPVLKQIAVEMQAGAVTPEQQQQAVDFSTQVDGIATASDRAAQAHRDFNGALEDGMKSGFNGFLDEMASSTHNVGDAFRALASGVVSSLRQILQQMIVNLIVMKLMKAILGGVSGGGGAASGGFGEGNDIGAGFNTGGFVSGPGTGTSDSIPARLSHGEFVTRAAVVAQPGALAFLEALNSGGVSVRRRGAGFAEGGLVGTVDPSAPSGTGGHAALSAHLDLDPALVLKRLSASPEWDRVHVSTTERNVKKISAALGR